MLNHPQQVINAREALNWATGILRREVYYELPASANVVLVCEQLLFELKKLPI